MRLQSLRCLGYRGLADATITLDPHLTVFVGMNGTGKSSVLDAVHLLLSQYSARLVGSPSSAPRLKDTDIRVGSEEARLTLCMHDDRVGDVSWTIAKQGLRQRLLKPRSSELAGLGQYVKELASFSTADHFLRGETLPIYYDQRRSILKIPLRERKKGDDSPVDAFKQSVSTWGVDFPRLSSWFKDRESDELRRQKDEPSYVDTELEAVRRAMSTATGLQSPFYSFKPPRGLSFKKNGTTLHFSQLSSGEQVFLALAADLGRRLSSVATDSGRPLHASGIVLIDEVELHLHPKWQRLIIPWLLRTFPACQFIMTTHSPQVLTEVRAQHIRILQASRRGSESHTTLATLGRDSNQLLATIFDIVPRRNITDKLLRNADEAVTRGDLKSARSIIDKLLREIEGSSPEIAVLEARIARRDRAAG